MSTLKIVRDAVGGYRVKGTPIIIARITECNCCWYVLDEESLETIDYFNGCKKAKEFALEYAAELAQEKGE